MCGRDGKNASRRFGRRPLSLRRLLPSCLTAMFSRMPAHAAASLIVAAASSSATARAPRSTRFAFAEDRLSSWLLRRFPSTRAAKAHKAQGRRHAYMQRPSSSLHPHRRRHPLGVSRMSLKMRAKPRWRGVAPGLNLNARGVDSGGVGAITAAYAASRLWRWRGAIAYLKTPGFCTAIKLQ